MLSIKEREKTSIASNKKPLKPILLVRVMYVSVPASNNRTLVIHNLKLERGIFIILKVLCISK